MVGVAVTASTEAVTGCFARGCGDGCDSEEGGELGLTINAVRLISHGHQELAGYFGPDTWKVTEHQSVGIEDLL